MKTYVPKNFSQPYIKALFYGATGNGKTRLAYSASMVSTMCPVLGINLGGNPLSTKDYDHSQITILEPETVQDLDAILNWVADGQKETSWSKKYVPYAPFKTVILDGITDTQAMIIDQLAGNLSQSLADQQVINGYKQWGQLLSATTTLARELMNLNLNIIITALETYNEKRGQFLPLLAGQGSERIAHIPYIVGRITTIERAPKIVQSALEKQNTETSKVLQISATENVPFAKWQYGTTKPFLLNPTMRDIYDLVTST